MASLLNCINRRGRAAPIVRTFVRSGNGRRRARLGVGTCPGTEKVGRRVDPSNPHCVLPGRRNSSLWRVYRRTRLNHAANRTAVVATGLAGLIRRIGNRSGVAMADHGRVERIGRGDAGGPRCADRREYLRQHRNQDDWQKFPQPPAHVRPFPTTSINHAGSRESSSGSRCRGDDAAPALFLTQPPAMQLRVAICHSFRRLLEF
jgi:hypothetical protein